MSLNYTNCFELIHIMTNLNCNSSSQHLSLDIQVITDHSTAVAAVQLGFNVHTRAHTTVIYWAVQDRMLVVSSNPSDVSEREKRV